MRLLNIHREWLVPEHFLKNKQGRRLPMRLIYPSFHEDHDDDFFLSETVHTLNVEKESEFLINYGSGDRTESLRCTLVSPST